MNLRSGAYLTDDEKHRFRLTRRWGDGPGVVFVMLNPSTADAFKDDPTIRKCMGFCKAWGLESLQVVNLYSFRTPYPKVLWQTPKDEQNHVLNDGHILSSLGWFPQHVVVAWGAGVPKDSGRPARVFDIIRDNGFRPMCLGTTQNGSPRHPLYVPYTQPLEEFKI